MLLSLHWYSKYCVVTLEYRATQNSTTKSCCIILLVFFRWKGNSPENIWKIALNGFNKFFCGNVCICASTYMCVLTNGEKEAHEFERDQGEEYGYWKEKG